MTLKVEQNPKKLWHGMTREDTARHENTRQGTRKHGKAREGTARHEKARQGTRRQGHEDTGHKGTECFLLSVGCVKIQYLYLDNLFVFLLNC